MPTPTIRKPKKARLKQAKISKQHGTVLCPHCKSDDLRYIEDEITVRRLAGIEGGKLTIDSHFDCDGDGQNPRLLCVECGRESSIPKGLEYDFA